MKAQADVIFLIVMLFVVIIALFAVDTIWSGFVSNPSFQAVYNATSVGKHAIANTTTSLGILNNGVVLLFLIGCIASIIAAAFTDSSPIFLVPALIILPIEILFAFIFHDAFFSIIGNSSFAGVATSYPVVITIFQYLPIVALVVAIIEIIVIFLK